MEHSENLKWLLGGDVSIQYQVYRDLFGEERKDLKNVIHQKGWGKQFLDRQNHDGHWGNSYYNPKWISTHYTLASLKHLGISKDVSSIQSILHKILYKDRSYEASQKLILRTTLYDDVCVNGMFLEFSSYFLGSDQKLENIVDFILSQQMDDGGFNCQKNRSGAQHSSLHSTISVLEGLNEFVQQGNRYRKEEIERVIREAEEFILIHKLYISDRTGNIINEAFLRFPYPFRWKYDILRAMDYFQNANTPYDERMKPALAYILSRRTDNGRWKVNAKYPGKHFFIMEQAGKESRWNTLRTLRVMKKYIEHTGLGVYFTDLIGEKDRNELLAL